jgi:predicted MFS family arabinose efflux permease
LTSGQYVHYPWLGRFSGAFSTLVMVLGLFGFASLLFAGRLRNRQLLELPVAYAMLLGMLSWVFFEPRFLTHLYPFAILSIFACLQVLQSRFDDDRSTTKRVMQSS